MISLAPRSSRGGRRARCAWPAALARLRQLGAEIVFWPSAYDGGLTLQCERRELTVDEVMRELGLELVPDYVARHEVAETATRAGRAPQPQAARRVPAQYV